MTERRLPVGAEVLSAKEAAVRVWAPRRRSVELVIEGGRILPLKAEERGYFSAILPLRVGERYRFRLDGASAFPDPASRFQPEGPRGPSELTDPTFAWSDAAWRGLELPGQVLYEIHVGTFTQEGTYAAARRRLARLRDLGFTAVEIMPLADFPGRFGWGYDGVNLFAPSHLYGRPEDLRAFVDEAHRLGLGVLLDVVYNHFGPDGFTLGEFSDRYLSSADTEWGAAINFDGEQSAAVREFYLANARYWIAEFHLDGLRMDATHQIFDRSSPPILREIAQAARAAAPDRGILVIAENEPQDPHLLRGAPDGCGLDALWNEDFHHTAYVALTGRREAYLNDYCGLAPELAAATRWGPLYQGQYYSWQSQTRGKASLDLGPQRYITFLENHDQAANLAEGLRLPDQCSARRYRALAALWLLGPGTPAFFQGQEAGARRRFRYFADHAPDLARKVRLGRAEFMRQFRNVAGRLPADPADESLFAACRLADEDLEENPGLLALHADLLRLRREDPVIRAQQPDAIHPVILNPRALALRWIAPLGTRLLVINLDRETTLQPCPEPLLAPPPGGWRLAFSSEDPRYGGSGAVAPVDALQRWRLPAESASLLEDAHGA